MNIIWHNKSKQFHLYNDEISYIIGVQITGELSSLYLGKRVHDKEDFSYLYELGTKSMTAVDPDTENYSMELNRQEYPSFGTTDFGTAAYEIQEESGSCVSTFRYQEHEIIKGKETLPNLPATYATEEEAITLRITLLDSHAGVKMILSYTLFDKYPVIARHAEFYNVGSQQVKLNKALSMSIDIPNEGYEWMQFSGAWSRERIPVVKKLDSGITAIESKRGGSSAFQNPFVIIKRPKTDEFAGRAYGFSFVYSGNFLAQAEVDNYNRLRFLMGINPERFCWPLNAGDSFVTPEVVMCYSDMGLNSLSQTYHKLYNNNLVRGQWKNKPRPILLNNWEATFMNFTEESILKIAKKGKEAGVELFVLDDGWFGQRDDDFTSLGDWVEDPKKLPQGMGVLCHKINAMGLDFGFWIEPEMVNPVSNLYRKHPDWALAVPGVKPSLSRHQMVLDFSKDEVVDYIFDMLCKVIGNAPIKYIKWDMNRPLTECFSINAPAEEQGMIYHKYVLGVYRLYEKLINAYPEILFESCSSGGSRFDAGMLYYAPQAWCSDDTDAIERIGIQYGSSYGYPIASVGAHVSAVPNQQTGRSVPIDTRANVAYFGTFGYELDLNEISDEEFELVKKQIEFMKAHRELIQYGTFYRLKSPFGSKQSAWIVVSEDKKKAILGFYCIRADVNNTSPIIKLAGLDSEAVYKIGDSEYYGDELMNIGFVVNSSTVSGIRTGEDYSSCVVELNS